MDNPAKKKLKTADKQEDRISMLSDDLIHQILLFLDDTRLAVQTSILSKRWKSVWEALPFLSFHGYDQHYKADLNKYIYSKFVNHVFSSRDHQCRLHKLDLCPSNGLHAACLIRYVKYAISHDVENLHVESDRYCAFSMFNSNYLKELKLTMPFEDDNAMESDCWSLPNLTNLYLKRCYKYLAFKYHLAYKFEYEFPRSCLICLSRLTTLCLDNCKLPVNLSLPSLTTLKLKDSTLPEKVWDFPALLTLELDNVLFKFSMNIGDYIRALASLRNLAIYFREWGKIDCVISGFQLVNLTISAHARTGNDYGGEIVVSAPKLSNFTAIGVFPITFEHCELENVEIKILKSKSNYQDKQQGLYKMFSQLGSAKNLTLDTETLQVLYEISYSLLHLKSPFYRLKHLKLPLGCKGSSICSIVRHYLLEASPKATIVETPKTQVQDNVITNYIPLAISKTAQNVVLEQPLATPNKKKIKSQYTKGAGIAILSFMDAS